MKIPGTFLSYFRRFWHGGSDAARKKRARLLVAASASSGVSRAVIIGANLLQVPIALRYLESEAFGLWVTLAGMLQLVGFTDLGMGLGIQNRISNAMGRDDFDEIERSIGTGLRMLSCSGAVVLLVGMPLCFALPWADMLKVENVQIASDLPVALALMLGVFGLGLPLGLAERVSTGLQRGWLTSFCQSVTSLLTLGAVCLAWGLGVGFKTFVLLASLPLFLQHIIIGIAVARVTRTRFYLFCWNRFDNGAVSGVVRQGFGFLVPQAAAVFITNVPALFLSAVLGPAAVTPYKLCQQMGNALMMLQALPINPLWPAYAEAKSRGDWRWIRKMFRISLLYCTFSGLVVGAGIWLLGEWVVKIWTRGMVPELPPGLLPGFGLWLLLQAVIGAPNIFLNGIGKLRKQAIGAACCAVCFIIAAPFAIRQWGVPAPVFCLTFQTLLFSGTLMCWDTILIFRNHAIIRGR